MRIAFHVPSAGFLESCPGGENPTSGDGVVIANLVEALRKRGHNVRIVSRVDARDFWQGRLPAHWLVTEAAMVRGRMKRFSPDAWLVYFSRITCPDLFGWWLNPKRYVILKGGAPGTKNVMATMPKLWRTLYTYVYRQSLLRADKIEAFSPKDAAHLHSQGVPEERICVLPCPIKPWTHIPCREEARHMLGLPQDARIILCVSRLAVRRGPNDRRPSKTESVLHLVRAFASLPPNALLLLVGDGPGRRQVEEQVARLQVGGRVRFAGTVEHSDVVWYDAACDFFAFPELSEGNSAFVASVEAQACGRPVVSMQNSRSLGMVDPGRTGLLAKDLDEFQAHLLALVQDRNRCQEMGRAGPAFVARSLTVDVRARQVEELLLGQMDVSAIAAEKQPTAVQNASSDALLDERPGDLVEAVKQTPGQMIRRADSTL